MRATIIILVIIMILIQVIILTKAHRVVASIMAKGCIVA